MLEIIHSLIDQFPVLSSLLVAIGVLRAIFKPLMTLLEKYVEATPSKKDDKWLLKVKESKYYAGIVWLIDYFASIKMPKKK